MKFEDMIGDGLKHGIEAACESLIRLNEISKTRDLYPFELESKKFAEDFLESVNHNFPHLIKGD